jgi:hypothetical protein
MELPVISGLATQGGGMVKGIVHSPVHRLSLPSPLFLYPHLYPPYQPYTKILLYYYPPLPHTLSPLFFSFKNVLGTCAPLLLNPYSLFQQEKCVLVFIYFICERFLHHNGGYKSPIIVPTKKRYLPLNLLLSVWLRC